MATKPSVMDELEALKTVTTSESQGNSEEDKGRKRAAGQWISHYIAVTKLKEEFLASGGKPEEFTKTTAEKLLLASWDISRETAI